MDQVMKLWKIERADTWGFDEFNSAVVAAESEQGARMTTPDGRGFTSGISSVWASSPELVRVEFLGVAKTGTQAGVVLASFNAG